MIIIRIAFLCTLLISIKLFDAYADTCKTVVKQVQISSISSSSKDDSIKNVSEKHILHSAQKDYMGPWWLGHLITVLGFIVVAYVAFSQIKRQVNINFKINTYHNINKLISNFSEISPKANTWGITLPFIFERYNKLLAAGYNPMPIDYRAMDFSDINNKLNLAIIEIVCAIEQFLIIEPKLSVFKTAFIAASFDINKTYSQLFEKLLKHLPMDSKIPDQPPLFPDPPNQNQIKEIEKLSESYRSSTETLSAYVMDFQNELQELLLSNIFKNKIPKRAPLDPVYKVISIKNAKVLEEYFICDTEWGKSQKQINKIVTERIERIAP
jgi:hypothetical protein